MNHLMGVSWDEFKIANEAWSPTETNVADIRRLNEFFFHQGSRPMQRADSFGAAFSAMSLLEGIYTHVLNVARAEQLAAANASEGASGGATNGSGDAAGGSAG